MERMSVGTCQMKSLLIHCYFECYINCGGESLYIVTVLESQQTRIEYVNMKNGFPCSSGKLGQTAIFLCK